MLIKMNSHFFPSTFFLRTVIYDHTNKVGLEQLNDTRPNCPFLSGQGHSESDNQLLKKRCMALSIQQDKEIHSVGEALALEGHIGVRGQIQ